MKLDKFWFETDPEDDYTWESGIRLGIGVTAYDYADALRMIEEKLGKRVRLVGYKKIVSLNELEQNHVLPNIGLFAFRGIWFPNGL
jgi:hypothetical protein